MYTISVGNAFGHSIYTDLMMQEITEGVNAAFDNIDKIFAEYHQSLLSPENMEAELFGEAQAQQQQTQPQNKGIVASLGAAIRSLISAFGQMIQRLGEAFMSNDAKIRKQQEEIDRQLAADPDLKRKVMKLSAEGALDIKDMKDINQLSAEVDKLLEEKDPKTISGKLAKLKKEWDDPNGKFLKRVAAVGTVLGVGATAYKIYNDMKKNKEASFGKAKNRQKNLQDMAEYFSHYNYVSKDGKGLFDSVNSYEAKLAAVKFEQGCYNESLAIMKHNYDQCSKGQQIILKFIGNHKGKTVDANHNVLKNALQNKEMDNRKEAIIDAGKKKAEKFVKDKIKALNPKPEKDKKGGKK